MPKTRLDILIISDLHAHPGDPRKGDAPSFYSTNQLFSAPDINPLAGVVDLVKQAGLSVDWVVCPGDLGDKADPTSQKIAWEGLESIRSGLNANLLIGTTGNHDVDSRRALPEFDPKSSLQQLNPMFPIRLQCYAPSDGVYSDRFWSRNFVLVPFDEFDCTLLILNSCAFHGFVSDAKKKIVPEYIRGKISPLTLSAIKNALSSLTTKANILLVHHHPMKIPYVDDDNSVMLGGDLLLEQLKDTNKQWLVLHGHAHVPSLIYAGASQFAPIVLSSASVAAKTSRMKGGYARNQIHHLSVHLNNIESSGAQLFGQVTSWTWAFEYGWLPSSGFGVLPFHAGFGYRFDAIQTRDQIVAQVKAAAPGLLRWSDVLDLSPKISYLAPDDLISLNKLLEGAGVKVECDNYGVPAKLEWPE